MFSSPYFAKQMRTSRLLSQIRVNTWTARLTYTRKYQLQMLLPQISWTHLARPVESRHLRFLTLLMRWSTGMRQLRMTRRTTEKRKVLWEWLEPYPLLSLERAVLLPIRWNISLFAMFFPSLGAAMDFSELVRVTCLRNSLILTLGMRM